MKGKGKYNYDYLALNIKASVVKRFRLFARKLGQSQSETLNALVEFFEWHGFLPNERFDESIMKGILKNRKKTERSIKRIEATIAILRNIEKTDIKPSTAMLLSLFDGIEEEPENETSLEQYFKDGEPIKIEDFTASKVELEAMELKLNKVAENFSYVLEKIKVTKSGFGKVSLKIDITENELIKFKRIVENL